jgi:hypothetical protein
MPAPLPPDDAELARLLRHSLRTLPEVPRWASERALAVWRAPVAGATAAAQPGLLQRLQAVLSFDSWQAQPTLALRSAGQTRGARSPRQLLYAVGEHDIDIRIQAQPTPPGGDETQPPCFQVSGQVLGPATGGSVTWLALGPDGQPLAPTPAGDAEQGARSVSFDDLGEFVLADLPTGRGLLRLRLGSATADLPTIELQGDGLPTGTRPPAAG